MGVSQARSRNYPILGAQQQLASSSCIKMGHRSSGYPAPLPARLLTDRAFSPTPARKNNSLPPCVDAIDDALQINSGTQHDNVGNTASILRVRGKIFSQTIGKRKDAARASFLHFYARRAEGREPLIPIR